MTRLRLWLARLVLPAGAITGKSPEGESFVSQIDGIEYVLHALAADQLDNGGTP